MAPSADNAAAAVAVLLGTGHHGKTDELAGDSAYSAGDLSTDVSAATGKHVPYNNLPLAAYADILKSFGLPDFFAVALARWENEASEGVSLTTAISFPALSADRPRRSRKQSRPLLPRQLSVPEGLAPDGAIRPVPFKLTSG
jgi:uncharacterized protein YbjT (DUF2867 family)